MIIYMIIIIRVVANLRRLDVTLDVSEKQSVKTGVKNLQIEITEKCSMLIITNGKCKIIWINGISNLNVYLMSNPVYTFMIFK